MRFVRTLGGKGDAPGQFDLPWGVAVVRGLLVVSEAGGKRLQVLTPKGVPLQVLGGFEGDLSGMCADEQRVWVADRNDNQVHVLVRR